MKSLLLTLTVVALAGCGASKSNPVSEYGDLKKNSVPPYQEKPVPPPVVIQAPPAPEVPVYKPQEFIGSEVHRISAEEMTFVEGVPSTYKIKARVFVDKVSFDLEAKNLPEGAKLQKAGANEEPGTWLLSFNPPGGFIPPGETYRKQSYQIALKILKAPDEKTASILREVAKEATFSFLTFRTKQAPTMEIKSLPDSISEGSVIPFTVEVKDPASYKGFEPRVDAYYDGLGPNEKGFEGNGSVYVRPDPSRALPQQSANGTWVFHMLFDTKSVPLSAQLDKRGDKPIEADGLQVRLSLKAYSKTGVSSPEALVKRKIRFVQEAKAPSFVVDSSANAFAFEAGRESNATILVNVADHRGTLTVEPTNISTWAGKPALKCVKDAQDQSLQVCHFRWKVPCDAESSYKLEIKATNTLVGKPKTSTFSQEIRITKGSACEAKPALAKSAPAASQDAPPPPMPKPPAPAQAKGGQP